MGFSVMSRRWPWPIGETSGRCHVQSQPLANTGDTAKDLCVSLRGRMKKPWGRGISLLQGSSGGKRIRNCDPLVMRCRPSE